MKLTKPICFFDLETTGTNTATDRIVEISILKKFPDGTSETKTRRINPEIPIPISASEIHGITNEQVKDEPTFKQVASGIMEYIEDCDIAGYNSNAYDVPLLYTEFQRAGVVWDYSATNFIDVFNIWRRKEERTLSDAYKIFCKKDLEEAHGAEADVLATVEIFVAQLDKYQDLPQEISELALFCNYDRPLIDITGKFDKDADGDLIFNFGKNKGRKLKQEKDYCRWMLGSNFPPDVIELIKETLK